MELKDSSKGWNRERHNGRRKKTKSERTCPGDYEITYIGLQRRHAAQPFGLYLNKEFVYGVYKLPILWANSVGRTPDCMMDYPFPWRIELMGNGMAWSAN